MGEDVEWLEETISHGIDNAEYKLDEADRYGGREIQVDIEVSHGYNLDRLERYLDNGKADQLTPTELGVLVKANRLDPDDLDQFSPESDHPIIGDGTLEDS